MKTKNKRPKLSTDGLNTDSVKLTTTVVSKEDLINDFSILWYNVAQFKKGLNDKRIIKVYEKHMTNLFCPQEKYPLKNDLEAGLYLTLEELRATVTLMVEALTSELDAKK